MEFEPGMVCSFRMVQATMAFAFMLIMGLITLNRYIKTVRYIKAAFFPSEAVARLNCGVVRLILVLSTRPPLWGWGRMKFDSYVFVYTFNWKEGRTIFIRQIDCKTPQRYSICDNLLLMENSSIKN